MIDPNESEPNQQFERKVRSAFRIQDPEQQFVDQLGKKLADRFQAIERTNESKNIFHRFSQRLNKLTHVVSPVAWGAIAIILLVVLIWGIETLRPRSEPVKNIPLTPSPIVSPTQATITTQAKAVEASKSTQPSPIISPLPSMLPTQTGGAEGVINLPTIAGMPVHWPEVPITSENAGQLTQLARWASMPILDVAWSLDGKSFAVCSPVEIYIYNATTLKEIKAITRGSNTCHIAFSADGTMLASSGNTDFSITLWDLANGRSLLTLTGQKNFITILAFSPDGKILAAAAYGEPLMFWDVSSGQKLRSLSGASAVDFAFSPDGKSLATADGEAKTLRLWDVDSGMELHKFTGHTSSVYGVAFSPDGSMLASTSKETIRLWDVATAKQLQVILDQAANGAAFLPDGKTLVYANEVEQIRLWDITKGRVLRTSRNLNQCSNTVLSPDRKTVLCYSWQGHFIYVYDIYSGDVTGWLDWQSDMATCLAFSPDGRLVAIGLISGNIKLLDATNWQELRTMTMTGNEHWAMSLAFSPDGALLVSSDYSTTKLWDVATGEELYSIEGVSERGWGAGGLPSVDFSQDGKLVGFAGPKNQVRLWDVARHVELQPLGEPDSFSDVSAVAFSPDGKILASGYALPFGAYPSHTITLWDPISGQELRTLDQVNTNISSLAFSPDGKMLAAGSWEMEITMWDVASGSELYRLSFLRDDQYPDEISSLAFSPDGEVLAIACENRYNITLLDATSGKELANLPNSAYVLAFSPDGKLLISSTRFDETVRLWGIAP